MKYLTPVIAVWMLIPIQSAKGNPSSATDFFPTEPGFSRKYRTDFGKNQVVITHSQIKSRSNLGNGRYSVAVNSRCENQSMTEHYEINTNGVQATGRTYKSVTSMSGNYNPPRTVLPATIRAGVEWRWQGDKGLPGRESQTWKVEESKSAELVDVPAGKFHCVKIVGLLCRGDQVIIQSDWFSRGVGLVKSVTNLGDQQVTTELISHGSTAL